MKTPERLAVVKTKIEDIQKDISTIKNNDLAHIAADMKICKDEVNKINTNFRVYKAKTAVWAGIFIFIATVLSQIFIKIFV